MIKYLHEIFHLLGESKRKLPVMLTLFIAMSALDIIGLSLISPYIGFVIEPKGLGEEAIQIMQNYGLPTDQKKVIMMSGFVIVLVFAVKASFSILINKKIIIYSTFIEKNLRSYLMNAYQSLPYIKYLERNSSEYVYSIQQLTLQYSTSVVQTLLRTFSDGLAAIMIISMLAWTNLYVLLSLVVMVVTVVFVYDFIFRENIRIYGAQAIEAGNIIVKGINEGMEGIKEVRILGVESYFYNKVHNGAKNYAHLMAKSQLITIAPRYLLEFLMIILIVAFITIMIQQNVDLHTQISTLGLFGVASLRLLPIANVFTGCLMQLRHSRKAVALLYNDMKNLENIKFDEKSNLKQTDFIFKELTLDSVSFRYPNTELKTLKNISLSITAGESIGLIGSSGTGKTTLVDVLLGLLEPQKGEILFNGKIMSNNLAEWRAQVAYLPQQVFLTDNTLKNNVALGISDELIDEQKVINSLKKARLKEFAKQLPNGLSTMLGERGVRLSGGQRQRIALARAFYHNRKVLVLDEATSSLDNQTESEIIEEINLLRGNITLIIIAHRLTTLMGCDRVYRLGDGVVVESGKPEVLLRLS